MATAVETYIYHEPPRISKGPGFNLNQTEVQLANEQAAMQFAYLASQHHSSDYSHAKYGPNGSPVPYIPLSIQNPIQFRDLQARQQNCIDTKVWWYHPSPGLPPPHPKRPVPVVLGPCGNAGSMTTELEKELSTAMDEELSLTAVSNGTENMETDLFVIKTSSSHPINISAIIPPELIDLLSSHIVPTSNDGTFDGMPVIFEVLPSFALDTLMANHMHLCTQYAAPIPTTFSKIDMLQDASLRPPDFIRNIPLQLNEQISDALNVAMNSKIGGHATTILADASTRPIQPSNKLVSDQSSPAKTPSHPLTERPSSPSLQNSDPAARPPLFRASSSSSVTKLITSPSILASIPDDDEDNSPDQSAISRDYPTPQRLRRQSSLPAPSFTLGNLLLSSCPGKKVRLTGPVKGRPTVNRDLETDLRRIYDLGVRCIVCCLDDTELEFLGASWPAYEKATKDIGLDVLRLPTPEGLPPSLSPAALDDELTALISRYTLNGIPVLVHCRGGVGRAGVVACCWVLRLGLCGWFNQDPASASIESASSSWFALSSSHDSAPLGSSAGGLVPQDTVMLVERVINTVRIRRSMKAIETYEQVKFLVDYVDYLRSISAPTPSTSV